MKISTIFVWCLLILTSPLLAQKGRVITGQVSTSPNQSLENVTVTEKGTNNIVTANTLGKYTITLTKDNSSLIFSYVGYATKELPVGEAATVNATLEVSANLEEVVVTSFGIKKQKRELGYTTQTVSSADLNVNRQTNVVNALQGKVAGVTISSGGGAPGQGSRILIRGINSLNPNSNNQPLFIVDGVEVDNSTITTGSGDLNRGMSNRAADINPDDIENISVLRGGAATALYGIRAANGVIIITTKSAKAGKINVTYTGSYGFENVNKTPDVQNKFTKGSLGKYDIEDFFPSWGPTIDSAKKIDPNHPDEIFDNYKRAFETGHQMRHSISVTGGTEVAQLGASFSYFDQTGVIPFSDYKNYNARVNGNFNISKKVRAGASLNFINSGGYRVNADRYGEQLTYWSPRFDVMDYIKPDGTQKNYNRMNDNPVYLVATNHYKDNVNRVIASANISYIPTDWLNFVYRFGNDFYNDARTRTAPGPKGVVGEYILADNGPGFYHEHNIRNRVLTSTFLANVVTNITNDLSFDLKLGQDLRETKLRRTSTEGDTLVIPDLFLMQNAKRILASSLIDDYRNMGVFADLTLGYKNYLFLNLTGRQDITSTLAKENRSYFYPSVNLSYVFSDMFQFPTWWNYGKFKASFARIGKDASTYATTTGFTSQTPPVGNVTPWTYSNTLGNIQLKPEFTNTYEMGFELRFLKNRLGLELTGYQAHSEDLILPIKISNTTGFDEAFVNAGEIKNKGIEVTVTALPVKTRDFTWNFNINFSANKNEVVKLNQGLTEITFGGTSTGYLSSGPSFKMIPGYAYGALFGITYKRYYGSKTEDPMLIAHDQPWLIGADGFPIRETDPKKVKYLGSTQPKYIASTLQTVSYKQLSLSALLDIRQGQMKYNQLANYMAAFGIAKYTENRTETTVFPGVLADGTPNTKRVYLGQAIGPDGVNYGQGYYRNVYRGVTENFVEDASWVRLRSLTLTYSLPSAMLKRTRVFNGASVSLTGNNLWLSTKYTGFDPETTSFNAASNVSEGFSGFTYPGVRSFLATVNIQF